MPHRGSIEIRLGPVDEYTPQHGILAMCMRRLTGMRNDMDSNSDVASANPLQSREKDSMCILAGIMKSERDACRQRQHMTIARGA